VTRVDTAACDLDAYVTSKRGSGRVHACQEPSKPNNRLADSRVVYQKKEVRADGSVRLVEAWARQLMMPRLSKVIDQWLNGSVQREDVRHTLQVEH
jgi:hypothetical protein